MYSNITDYETLIKKEMNRLRTIIIINKIMEIILMRMMMMVMMMMTTIMVNDQRSTGALWC